MLSERTKILTGVIAVCVTILCLSNYYFTVSGNRLSYYYDDDTHYYTKISENLIHGEFFTFDQNSKTNGFHPLWAAIAAPLHLIANEKESYTRIYFILQYILFIVSSVVLYLIICRTTKSNTVSFFITFVFATMPYFNLSIINGLETSLFIFLALTFLLLFHEYSNVWMEQIRFLHYLLFFFTGALFLSRLDGGLFHTVGLIIPFALINSGKLKTDLKNLFSSLLLLGLMPIFFVLVSWYHNGNPIPVSGLMKRFVSSANSFEFSMIGILNLLDFATVYNFPNPYNKLKLLADFNTFLKEMGLFDCRGYQSYYFGEDCSLIFLSFFISGSVIFFYFLFRCRFFKGENKNLLYLDFFALSSIALVLFNKINYGCGTIMPYYCVTFSISQLLMLSYILHKILENRKPRMKIVFKALLFPILLVCLSVSVFFHNIRGSHFNREGGYHYWYHSAKWLKNNTPPQATVAAYNAGILGFFSERRVINLDGKVNSHEYLNKVVVLKKKDVVTYRSAVIDYLEKNNVEYFADRFPNCNGMEEFFPEHADMFELLYQTDMYSDAICGKVYKFKPRQKEKTLAASCKSNQIFN